MILYPAIDLKNGHCVRLLRGDMNEVTVFNEDPVDQARAFLDAGCQWLHLVDLDGAIAGVPVNVGAVEKVLAETDLPVQLGGGIRTLKSIETWIEKGVSRVIIGTAAVRTPDLVAQACQAFPGQVAVAIDAREGFVAIEGWTETSEVRALDLALQFEAAGAAALVYTDVNRDGAMGGLNLDFTLDLAFALTAPLIAAGGVSDIADLKAVKAEAAAGIDGVIVGRALYDGRIDVGEAVRLLAEGC